MIELFNDSPVRTHLFRCVQCILLIQTLGCLGWSGRFQATWVCSQWKIQRQTVGFNIIPQKWTIFLITTWQAWNVNCRTIKCQFCFRHNCSEFNVRLETHCYLWRKSNCNITTWMLLYNVFFLLTIWKYYEFHLSGLLLGSQQCPILFQLSSGGQF